MVHGPVPVRSPGVGDSCFTRFQIKILDFFSQTDKHIQSDPKRGGHTNGLQENSDTSPSEGSARPPATAKQRSFSPR